MGVPDPLRILTPGGPLPRAKVQASCPVVSRTAILALTLLLSACGGGEAGGGGGGGEALRPEAGQSEVEASTYLRLRSEMEALGPDADPWVLAHLLLAVPEARARERAPLIITLLDRWGIETSEGITFPLHRPEGRGEQHPDLVLKALAECALETGTPAASARLRPLLEAALARAKPPADFRGWNDAAWLLHALGSIARVDPEQVSPDRPIVGGGDPLWTVEALARGALRELERLDRPVEAALGREVFTRPSGESEPEVAGIWGATCGGQHLLQAVVAAARAGLLPPAEGGAVIRRLEILIARVDAESEFREQEARRAAEHGVSASVIARRRAESLVKLRGHALETISLAIRAAEEGGIPADGGTLVRWRHFLRAQAEAVEELLRVRLEEIDPEGRIVPRLRVGDPLAWEMWFGDGAHALHGLRRAAPHLTPARD